MVYMMQTNANTQLLTNKKQSESSPKNYFVAQVDLLGDRPILCCTLQYLFSFCSNSVDNKLEQADKKTKEKKRRGPTAQTIVCNSPPKRSPP